jgi:hypothetical protein
MVMVVEINETTCSGASLARSQVDSGSQSSWEEQLAFPGCGAGERERDNRLLFLCPYLLLVVDHLKICLRMSVIVYTVGCKDLMAEIISILEVP